METQIEKSATDYEKLKDLMEEKERLTKELDHKMERWVYLNDLAEQIEAEKNSR